MKVVVMMIKMHTVKYEYQTVWQFQLRFDVVHIQKTGIITYSSQVHIYWNTKLNVASKHLVFLCINENESFLSVQNPEGYFCMHAHACHRVTEIVKRVLFTFIAIKPRVVRILNKLWQ
jgi:hypothetical protein